LPLGHRARVTSASFSPDSCQIVTASADGTAWLWDSEGDLITILEGHTGTVTSADFSPDGSQIVAASSDATVRLWVADIEILLSEGKRRLFQMLTLEECKQFFPVECPSSATEVPIP
jgi:WD40 repeat protein